MWSASDETGRSSSGCPQRWADPSTEPRHVRDGIPFLKPDNFKEVSVRRSDGRHQIVYVAMVNTKHRVKVKGLTHHVRLFLCAEDPSRLDPEEVQFLLCNDERMGGTEVVRAYGLRTWEEVFYRQGKDELGLDQCEVRREERLLRHWVLVMVAWTLLETFRLRGDLADRSQKELETVESVARLLRDICRLELWLEWLRDEEHVKRFVRWFCETRGLRVAFDGS